MRVARTIGGDRGLDVAMAYLEDVDRDIRRDAYDMGVHAGKAGEAIVRDSAESADVELATDAIALLTERKDRAAATLMRKLLNSPLAPVRAGAARLLGHIAGFAVTRQIESLLTDEDEDVRRAAKEALQMIMGTEAPELTPPPPSPRESLPVEAHVPAAAPVAESPTQPWTEEVGDEPSDLPGAMPPPQRNAARRAVLGATNLDSLRKATSGLLTPPPTPLPPPVATKPAPPPGPEMVPTPQLPAASEPLPPGAAWSPEDPIPLPSKLPVEALALIRLLGQCPVPHRPAVIEVLRRCDLSSIGEVMSGYRAGGDVHRGRGAAIAAAAMGNQRWVSTLRSYLRDPDEGVRACAIIAMANLATPSLLPQMSRLASDASAYVRASTAWSLGQAGVKLGAQRMVKGYIQPLLDDDDELVQLAAEDAIASLAG